MQTARPRMNDRPDGLAAFRRWASDVGKASGARISLGLDAMLGSRAAGRFGILYYHLLTDRSHRLPSPKLNVTPSTFHLQAAGLVERGFRFTTIGSVLARLEAGERLPRTAVITVDDGFQGVHEHAWPVCRRSRSLPPSSSPPPS